ncbi:LCP family protein [Halanaerobium sp. Z-7514]|uniref:LCP family protein n=1 Tax=Halanaerobium polyolivorans TaxID=2886943 RepID=A0AAW4WXV5_9FIRM|nr:LCP family protein [Halanaerobium polyolivorans]MCC3144848.1 LCP family protein [Halanaerobium polyolivorans]RQD75037.1 MAG: transcriptional regulator [Halanaerobium sp. MSAO_Bac5]
MSENNAENNQQDNQAGNNKYKWLGIALIALLILFIAYTGYYLERGMEPVDDDLIIGGDEIEEDPGFLDRILGLMNLGESTFDKELDILFVGLDDTADKDLDEVEANSIMIVQIRPEQELIIVETVDESMEYQDTALRDFDFRELNTIVAEAKAREFDHYLYLNFPGFEKVIDELGGVQITLEDQLRVPDLGLNLRAGNNLLSGKEALNYVRWKDLNNDTRLQRQRQVINAVLERIRGNNFLFNVRDLYNTVVNTYNSVETDISPVLATEILNYLRENRDIELEFID